MKNIVWFTCCYVVLTFVVLYGVLTKNTSLQLIAKVFLPILLFSVYLFTVPKEKINKLYLVMILLVTIGEFFITYPYQYFNYVILFYLLAHITFTIIIYRNYLRNESFFDVFTFSLPFLLTFSIIYILYELNFYWGIKVMILGVFVCINTSTVLLNYANNRSKQNYLFFLGMFLWLVADSFGGAYRFKGGILLFNFFSISLDFISEYLICIAFLLDAKEENYYVDESYRNF